MKLTLDLPETIKCVFVNYVYEHDNAMMISCKLLDSSDLKDGAEIKIEPKQD